jgi:holo-[acyl-carrier protein] synthase
VAETDDVVAEALEIVEIAEVRPLLSSSTFTEAERAYAAAKSDPERRLAARLAAKRAACRLLGQDIGLGEVEVVRDRGSPPRLRLGARALARLRAMGASRTLVSLTHAQGHAAAAVLFLRDPS